MPPWWSRPESEPEMHQKAHITEAWLKRLIGELTHAISKGHAEEQIPISHGLTVYFNNVLTSFQDVLQEENKRGHFSISDFKKLGKTLRTTSLDPETLSQTPINSLIEDFQKTVDMLTKLNEVIVQHSIIPPDVIKEIRDILLPKIVDEIVKDLVPEQLRFSEKHISDKHEQQILDTTLNLLEKDRLIGNFAITTMRNSILEKLGIPKANITSDQKAQLDKMLKNICVKTLSSISERRKTTSSLAELFREELKNNILHMVDFLSGDKTKDELLKDNLLVTMLEAGIITPLRDHVALNLIASLEALKKQLVWLVNQKLSTENLEALSKKADDLLDILSRFTSIGGKYGIPPTFVAELAELKQALATPAELKTNQDEKDPKKTLWDRLINFVGKLKNIIRNKFLSPQQTTNYEQDIELTDKPPTESPDDGSKSKEEEKEESPQLQM